MAAFLKIVSGIYLICIWLVLALFTGVHVSTLDDSLGGAGVKLFGFLVAVVLSIPAAAMFGFAQIISDVRALRDQTRIQGQHLAAMRRYYEPRP
jgi:di/tricarboxylate transporter